MTTRPSVTVDIYLIVDWSAVFHAKMIGDVINTQVLGTSARQSDDSTVANIGDCTPTRLIRRALIHPKVFSTGRDTAKPGTAQHQQRYSATMEKRNTRRHTVTLITKLQMFAFESIRYIRYIRRKNGRPPPGMCSASHFSR